MLFVPFSSSSFYSSPSSSYRKSPNKTPNFTQFCIEIYETLLALDSTILRYLRSQLISNFIPPSQCDQPSCYSSNSLSNLTKLENLSAVLKSQKYFFKSFSFSYQFTRYLDSPARGANVGQALQLLADLAQRSGLARRAGSIQGLFRERKFRRQSSGARHRGHPGLLLHRLLVRAKALEAAKAFPEPHNRCFPGNAGLRNLKRHFF